MVQLRNSMWKFVFSPEQMLKIRPFCIMPLNDWGPGIGAKMLCLTEISSSKSYNQYCCCKSCNWPATGWFACGTIGAEDCKQEAAALCCLLAWALGRGNLSRQEICQSHTCVSHSFLIYVSRCWDDTKRERGSWWDYQATSFTTRQHNSWEYPSCPCCRTWCWQQQQARSWKHPNKWWYKQQYI